ncbi:MAG: BACON domain-containing protein [Bacteroidales bacterium]|nr:BACON domain-containing protein [Bacteroidales bacterium]
MKAKLFLRSCLLFCMVALAFTSCKEEEEKIAPELKYVIDGSSPTNLAVAADGSTRMVSVESNGAWSVAVSAGSPAWIQVSSDKGEKNGTFTMTVSANANTSSRTGTLTFVMEEKTLGTLTVTQSGFGAQLTVVPEAPEQAPATGGVLEFSVAANTGWTYSLSAGAEAWLTETVKTDAALTLTVEPNTVTEARSATVTFSLADYSTVTQEVFVSQAAKIIDVPPVNIDLIAAPPVVLDKDQTSTQTTFSWSSTGAEHYALIFSKNADMSNPIYVVSDITSATYSLTHQQLQDAFIENAALGLKRFKTNILYWNVKADGAPNANSAGQFALSGMRYFRDVRGSEDLTYNVAVLPYPEGSETVWLGENLKTLKTTDGTDIATLLGDNFVASAQSVLATVPVPAEMHPFIGCYYRIEQLSFWKDRVIPAKWKIPAFGELAVMFNQARMAAPEATRYSVLRNPVAFPNTYAADSHKEMWNLWKMDFVPYGNGASVAAIPDQQCELDNPYVYFVMDSDPPKMFFASDDNDDVSNFAWANHAVPIRLIYTGDDE